MLHGDKLVVAMDLDRAARSRSRANSAVPGTVVQLGTGSRGSSELVNYNSRILPPIVQAVEPPSAKDPPLFVMLLVFPRQLQNWCPGQLRRPSGDSRPALRMVDAHDLDPTSHPTFKTHGFVRLPRPANPCIFQRGWEINRPAVLEARGKPPLL